VGNVQGRLLAGAHHFASLACSPYGRTALRGKTCDWFRGGFALDHEHLAGSGSSRAALFVSIRSFSSSYERATGFEPATFSLEG
jgi:hypothetical protein